MASTGNKSFDDKRLVLEVNHLVTNG